MHLGGEEKVASPVNDSWLGFTREDRPSFSCSRVDFLYQADFPSLVPAIGDLFAGERLTNAALGRFRAHVASGSGLTPLDRRFLADAFRSWLGANGVDADDDAVKGDIAETVFLRLRTTDTFGQPVRYRKKTEAISSKTAGWDVLEVFLTDEPWFILWEAKGTDEAVNTQAWHARRELNERNGPWLAKLSRLLEEEFLQSDGEEAAAFAATLHERAMKKDASYNVGIALVVDAQHFPADGWEVFGAETMSSAKQWGTLVGLPEFPKLRERVRKWILEQP